MNDISSDESTDVEEINKNFETEAQLIVETDTLPGVLSRLYYFENGKENENITKNITSR